MTSALARSVGDTLPGLSIQVTPTFIVATAIATRDFQDVHHDRDLAQQRGSKDIFINILTDNGLVQRFVTDWAGPRARITSISCGSACRTTPDDTLTSLRRRSARSPSDGLVTVAGRRQRQPR